jgi:hypothetical protein
MPVKVSDIEAREDRWRKNVLYNSSAMREHRAERSATTTEANRVRRRHANERNELGQALRRESVAVTHRHRVAADRHHEVSRAKPVQMEAEHKKELEEIKARHDRKLSKMRDRHRFELDRAEG